MRSSSAQMRQVKVKYRKRPSKGKATSSTDLTENHIMHCETVTIVSNNCINIQSATFTHCQLYSWITCTVRIELLNA